MDSIVLHDHELSERPFKNYCLFKNISLADKIPSA